MTTPITTSTNRQSNAIINIMASLDSRIDHQCFAYKYGYCTMADHLFLQQRILPAVPEQTTVETAMNMTPENRAHFESEMEAIHLILTELEMKYINC
ncbi:hypothetical protein Tco_0252088 [Tanacetum coccineum]